MYSIGSSIVMMCSERLVLMCSIIAAMVVVFPEPVAPVTKIKPRRISAICSKIGGVPKSRKVLTLVGILRKTIATPLA